MAYSVAARCRGVEFETDPAQCIPPDRASFASASSYNSRELQNLATSWMLWRMPELPDISAYLTALDERILGQPLEHVRIASAFLLRTAAPAVTDVEGHHVSQLRSMVNASRCSSITIYGWCCT